MNLRLTTAILLCAGTLTGCASATEPAAHDESHLTIDNCGHTWELAQAPQRVVVMKNTTPATLDALGVIDRVVATAGIFPTGYYGADLNEKLAALPSLSDSLDAGGHLQISREDVLAQNPDLVTGFNETVNPETLRQLGTTIVDEPALCGASTGPASFDDIYAHVDFYGKLFDRSEQARAYKDQLRTRIEEEAAAPHGHGRSVAVLYPAAGGGTIYAYGAASMSTAVAQAAGLHPVFADEPKRVFEVSVDQLIAANPDVIIALHSAEDGPDNATAAVDLIRQRPELAGITAVKDGAIHPMLLNRLDPPTPLAVDGLAELNRVVQ